MSGARATGRQETSFVSLNVHVSGQGDLWAALTRRAGWGAGGTDLRLVPPRSYGRREPAPPGVPQDLWDIHQVVRALLEVYPPRPRA